MKLQFIKHCKKRLILTLVLAAVLMVAVLFTWIPSFTGVRNAYQPSDQILLDRNGNALQQIRTGFQYRSLAWVPLSAVSKKLPEAVLFAEDRRFYQHLGVDFLAVGGIGRAWLLDASYQRRGGSTITMQLVKLLKLMPEQSRRDRIWTRVSVKMLQMMAATLIELRWTKEEILEAYLNLVTWRGELRGVGAAANGLFDKAAIVLDDEDAALLAALLKFPSERPERIIQRACFVLSSSLPNQVYEDCAQRYADMGIKLRQKSALNTGIQYAPHLAQQITGRLSFDRTAQIPRTTIDLALQSRVREILESRVSEISDRNVKDGAAIVLNYQTGEVLAYVGHAGSNTSSDLVDGVQAHRQAGSTLKPFLYELAMEKKFLTTESLIDDSPLSLSDNRGSYRPENYDHLFHGLIPLRVALGSSVNIPAVKVAGLVGVVNFVDRLKLLGFSIAQDSEWYGPSIALGTLDVSLWELAQAYGTLANHGKNVTPKLFLDKNTTEIGAKVLDPSSAWLIGHILSDTANRELSFGADSPLSTSFWTAAKTGTSKDMRDNWCLGYSDQYVVGVWVGNYSGEPMWNVSGVSGAAPAWADIMNLLHSPETGLSKEPEMPEGTTLLTADSTSRAPRGSQSAHITYPNNGLTIALDPDIPAGREEVGFEISAYHSELSLDLDGKSIKCTDGFCLWRPIAGLHKLALKDGAGKVLEAVEFRVR